MRHKFFLSIPHIAFLFDMRKHPRYEPCDGLRITVEIEGNEINALLVDICVGGMRILSADESIEHAKAISLSIDSFRVDLPCKYIREINCYYGIRFGDMNRNVFADLEYFIDNFTKKPPETGPTEIFR